MISIICAISSDFFDGGGREVTEPYILAGKWSIKQEHISEVTKA